MANNKSNNSFMTRIAAFVVDKRGIIFFFIIALCIFCAFSRNWVNVCNDITEYLPEETETKQGLKVMNENFTTFGSASILVDNITLEKAYSLMNLIEEIEGVKSVSFDDSSAHYKDAAALFSITFDATGSEEISNHALEAIKEKLNGHDVYISSDVGNPLKEIINREMLVVDILAVIVVVTVLLVTSRTYAEIPVLLMTFGCAAILNMGTNFLFGTISFVTDSIAIVLQLALAIDYAIILLHHFQEQRETKEKRDAAVAALSRAIPEIAASSLTTVAGLAAMCLMQFRLGPDMGVVLIKAILLSLFSVFFLMPGLLVVFSDWIDKTPHKSFVPRIDFMGKAAYKTRLIMPILFVAALVLGCICSHRVDYAYSEDSVNCFRSNEAQIAEKKINDTFGISNQLVIVVPSGDYDRENRMIEEIRGLGATEDVIGLASIEVKDGTNLTSALTPREFSELAGIDYEVAAALYAAYALSEDDFGQAATNLDNFRAPLIDLLSYLLEKEKEIDIQLNEETMETLDDLDSQLADARQQLMNNGWSRIVVSTDLENESEESFRYLEVLHGIVGRYYDESFITGNIQSCYDLKNSFETDNILISILTVVFVIVVLIFTFSSIGLPVLLIAIIQGAIWINFSTPYFKGEYLFFMTYLIVSSIQMGANIDYAIVISSRYMEQKDTKPLREAMIETLNFAFPTIITSGTMLASAGIIIGFLSSEKTIATIGVFLGQGTLISIFLVMCVLPQMLLLGDIVIKRTTFSISNPIQIQQKSGFMKVNGRIRGNFSGYIDADVNGIIRGNLSAIMDIGSVESAEESENEET